MKIEAHLHLLGRAGPFTVLTTEAVDELAENLASAADDDPVTVRVAMPDGEILTSHVVPGSVRSINAIAPVGQPPAKMIVLQLDLDDGDLRADHLLYLENAFPAAKTGLEATEDERARAMPILERQTEGGHVYDGNEAA